MVAKISTGSSMFGALAYNQEKGDNGEASRLPVNWNGNTTCIRRRERSVPNAPNLKRSITQPGT